MITAGGLLLEAEGGNGGSSDTGGRDSDGLLNTVEAYDPATNNWSTAAPMPTARDDLAADRKSVVYGKSVDLGGRRIIKKKKETYHPTTNHWSNDPTMPTARNALAAEREHDGRA